MDSPGDPALPLAGFRVPDLTRFLEHTPQALDEIGITRPEPEELNKAGVTYDKHPEARQ